MGTPALILKPAAFAAGFRGDALTTIVAIGQAEGGTPGLCNPDTTCVSCGPWQIYFGASGTCQGTRNIGGRVGTVTRTQAAGLLTNARCAWELSGHGNHYGAWTTYTGGAYLRFMPGGVGVTGTSPKPTGGTTATATSTGPCHIWCAAISTGIIPIPGCSGCKTVGGAAVGAVFSKVGPYLKIAGGGVLMLAGIALIAVGATGSQNKVAGLALAATGQPGAGAAVASKTPERPDAEANRIDRVRATAKAREEGVQSAREDSARREAAKYDRGEAEEREAEVQGRPSSKRGRGPARVRAA